VDGVAVVFAGAEGTRAASVCNRSAIADRVWSGSRVVDWAGTGVIGQESDGAGGHMRARAVWIRKTDNTNRDDGRLPVEPRMGQAFTY